MLFFGITDILRRGGDQYVSIGALLQSSIEIVWTVFEKIVIFSSFYLRELPSILSYEKIRGGGEVRRYNQIMRIAQIWLQSVHVL